LAAIFSVWLFFCPFFKAAFSFLEGHFFGLFIVFFAKIAAKLSFSALKRRRTFAPVLRSCSAAHQSFLFTF
jgi:hypothetical protein